MDWPVFVAERLRTDEDLLAWADRQTSEDLGGDLTWFSGALGKEMSRPKAPLIVHMFNHATHHRGQIHAMLTAEGQKPDDTDLCFLPAKYEEL